VHAVRNVPDWLPAERRSTEGQRLFARSCKNRVLRMKEFPPGGLVRVHRGLRYSNAKKSSLGKG